MNAKVLSIPKINLFEKKYLASRIACVIFIIFLGFYLIGGTRPLWATLVPIILIGLFVIQIVFQFKILNGILGGILFFVSVYLSLAVWSEFREFEVVTSSAKQLLFFGFGGCFLGVVLSLFMIWTFIRDY